MTQVSRAAWESDKDTKFADNTTRDISEGDLRQVTQDLADSVAWGTVDENAQTGTSYTLVLTDASKLVTMENAAANTLAIPANASVAFPVGTTIVVQQKGAGTTTITADTGVTLNGVSAGSGDLSAQWAGVSLYKSATDTWYAIGGIGTVA